MSEFSALYRRHAQEVYRFALHLSGDRDEAADIASETFVRAWVSPAGIRAETAKAYLFTIARNLFLQSLRHRRRRTALDETLRDPRPEPTAHAEESAELASVLTGLQQLEESDRAALLMRAVEEQSYDEIARALGITPVAARVKVHRARRALLPWRRA
jgi:RNA polymerase sigma-70 factor (ECF subfamily)